MSTEEPIRYPLYKRATAAAVLVLLSLWVSYLLLWPNPGRVAAGTGIAEGEPAPDFALEGLDGRTYRLSELRGRPVLINFWASWCQPCREEMPLLEETYRQHQSEGLVILAVNLAESDVTVKAFAAKVGLTFPILMDRENAVSRRYDILPLPTTYFVDRAGVVRARAFGALRKETLGPLLARIL